MNKHYISIIGIFIFLGCMPEVEMLFKTPPAEEVGIDFTNTVSATDDLNILDYLYFYNGGGITIGDVNDDGHPDIFFSGNQVKNKLYLNKGNLQFEDITEKAGVAGNSTWNTGAVMGDVNGDGLLDIYVCAVVGINGFSGYNELYINNGDTTFTESAAKYGLDFETYSSAATFLDFDLDGDLDMYLLNHAVHTQESFGRADLRYQRNEQTGDKLLRNDGNQFIDISEEAGIYGGVNGYGLGVAIADFNQDGWPDIYVGNDFHEDDYYYLNNKDGTFTECLKQYFGHTTRFSMGNDVTDINHDGWPDIFSLDMLPEDEGVLKASEGDDNIQIQKLRTQGYGYHYQFTRNMLFINQQNTPYTEVALLSGVAATDWSWSGLFADYNQDGEQDLFVSNGIPKRPNDLDFIRFASSKHIQKKIDNTRLVDQQALDMMPDGKMHNYIFKGQPNLVFQDLSGVWIEKHSSISGATAMGDLDNDGDLDLVTSNINSPPTLYINTTNTKAAYLKLRFDYKKPNRLGIGTKVFAYDQGVLQYKELYAVKGFQSSSEPMIHLGYDNTKVIDSIRIIWPDKSTQLLKRIPVNQTLLLRPENTTIFNYSTLQHPSKKIFQRTADNLGIHYVHKEDNYSDFIRQKLIPYQASDRGPATAIGDLDHDGKKDIFFGGSKYKPSRVFIQQDTAYVEKKIPAITANIIKEDVAALIADMDNDDRNDLFTGSGGADFYDKKKPLLDSYYIQKDSVFEQVMLPEYFENTAVIKAHDMDNDGDLDLFIGSHAVSNDFGHIPDNYILKNEKGRFTIVQNEALQKVGMVTDAIWDDFDEDGSQDLIVVGEWMAPVFFKNNNGILRRVHTIDEKLHGLWQRILPFDIDADGDTDYLLGNWGTNTKFSASEKYPMRMYYADFDTNGSTETIVCIQKNGKYYPIASLDELSEQIISLRKKFTAYKDFAGKTITEIFDKETLKNSKLLEVHTLQSGYLKNDNGNFYFMAFQNELQLAPITAFLNYDFDRDGKKEVLAAGNYFGVTPFHGRLGTFPGVLIKNEKQLISGHQIGLSFSGKAVKHLNIIQLKNKAYLLATINNDTAQVYELIK